MAKKPELPSSNKPKGQMLVGGVMATKIKKKPATLDSVAVGGTKRSVKDVAGAMAKLPASMKKGVDSSNLQKSSKVLGRRNDTSDGINKLIDGNKKKK